MPLRSPAYLAIAADLRAALAGMAPHAPLLSERVLAERHGVSRMTARQAVRLLEQEGVVYRSVPRGTFVAEPRIPLRIGSFTEEVVRGGREPSALLLWAETAVPPDAVREALGLAPNARAHTLQRVRSAAGEALALETTSVPAARCPDLLDGPLDGSLWAVLRERAGVVVGEASATFEVVSADEHAARHLTIAAGSPVIRLARRTCDVDGVPFEVATDLYRADRASFAVTAQLAG